MSKAKANAEYKGRATAEAEAQSWDVAHMAIGLAVEVTPYPGATPIMAWTVSAAWAMWVDSHVGYAAYVQVRREIQPGEPGRCRGEISTELMECYRSACVRVIPEVSAPKSLSPDGQGRGERSKAAAVSADGAGGRR